MQLNSIDDLIKTARSTGTKNNRVAVAMAEEHHVIQAIKIAMEMGLITPFLIGNSAKIKSLTESESLNISENQIIHTNSEVDAVKESINLIRNKKADMIMKGLVSTKILLREVLNPNNNLTNNKLASHLAIFESPFYHKPFGLTDAAMNIAPTIDEKLIIIKNAVIAFQKLGIARPKVALLAAVETINPKIQATTDAEKIVRIVDKSFPECIIDGPLALDLAVSKEAANIKNITGVVAGDADILIAPELNSGNVLYKSLSYLGNARLAGIILGAKCPVILTSRADSDENKLLSIALAICLC